MGITCDTKKVQCIVNRIYNDVSQKVLLTLKDEELCYYRTIVSFVLSIKTSQ